MVFQAEDRAKAKKQQAELAIQLALQGRWTEAVQLNRSIIDSFPTDVDAFNRLGKAMTELGRYGEAREAYMKALEIDPLNSIARKNLARLATLGEEAAPRAGSQKLSPQMFIEEMGKTGITTLIRADMDIAARMTAGDQVLLQRQNGTLIIKTTNAEYIGEIEPRLAQRLIKLMDGGNEYVAAISALGEQDVRVFIRETFQHASQTGKLSFPPTVTESFRPYVKERLLRQDTGETYFDEGEEGDEWEPGGESDETDVTIYGFRPRAAAAEEAEEEEEER
ncbi:MAG TPA: tetratricopeptide repeat protein [Dehalococcoidia bacterium]|nr:tetratricopeptide repeat protein [Dehalococcoidia bacterium]